MSKSKEQRREHIPRIGFKVPLSGEFLVPGVPEFVDDDDLRSRVLALHERAGRLRETVKEYNAAAVEKLEIATVYAHNLRVKKLAIALLDAAADAHAEAGPVCADVAQWLRDHCGELSRLSADAKAKLREHLATMGFDVPIQGQSAGEWGAKIRNHSSVLALSAESDQAREAATHHGLAASHHGRGEAWCRAESAKRLKALATGSFEELVAREAAAR